ncbi:MAG: hypothetical protein ACOH2L_19975 [Devosia sp.]
MTTKPVQGTRPLPISLPHVHGQFDAIDLAAWAIRDLYSDVFAKSRGTGKHDRDLHRIILLSSNLPRAEAEMLYRGTAETLLKTRQIMRDIAEQTGSEVQIDFSAPDLDGLPLNPVPAILGLGEPESEWECVNRVRCQLDWLRDGAEGEVAIDLALLWASLPRAETELEFCGTRSTLDRIRFLAEQIRRKAGAFPLIDLDREVRVTEDAKHSKIERSAQRQTRVLEAVQ